MTTARWQQTEGVFQAIRQSPADRELNEEGESILACYGKGENSSPSASRGRLEANQLAEKT